MFFFSFFLNFIYVFDDILNLIIEDLVEKDLALFMIYMKSYELMTTLIHDYSLEGRTCCTKLQLNQATNKTRKNRKK